MTNTPQNQNTSINVITGFAIGLAIGAGDAIYEHLTQQSWIVRVLITSLLAGLVAGGVAYIGKKLINRGAFRKQFPIS